MLKFCSLYSGSSGNSLFVETQNTKILIDAGVSSKKIENALQDIGINPSDLDGILVTHEHIDHVQSLGTLSKKFDLPVFANQETFDAMPKQRDKISDKNIKTFKVTDRPLAEERELHISLTLNDNNEWVWEVDTNIPKYINALKKRGWEQTSEGVLVSDGTVQCATFRSTDKKPISFRDLTKVREKRVMSEEHIAKLRAGLQKNKVSDE